MGRAVAKTVAGRLGRSLLELGGNNARRSSPRRPIWNWPLRAIVFAAAGTCGQRCTTLRRLIVHRSIADELLERLLAVYERLPIGNPLDDGVLVGPLIDERAFEPMQPALAAAKAARRQASTAADASTDGVPAGGFYVRPAIVEIAPTAPIVQHETFAPILYFMRYATLDEAIAMHNGVPQDWRRRSSRTTSARPNCSARPAGSDCGIANVNIGTSGAEIGGAFGGEKETGGGRESGSDAWKAYMRRATNTINYSTSCRWRRAFGSTCKSRDGQQTTIRGSRRALDMPCEQTRGRASQALRDPRVERGLSLTVKLFLAII